MYTSHITVLHTLRIHSAGKIYQLNAEFQRIASRDKKALLSEWERLKISSRKLEIPSKDFTQGSAQ